MGFFDKMFEKKECAICGTELGLLGKTKINEGYLCKECAGKLAPGFLQPYAYAFGRSHQHHAR